MRRIVLGMTIGLLTAATLAWALEVRLPTRTTAKATVVVDEIGAVLFGSTPAKVEVTNCQSGTPTMVVKDVNGVVMGTPSRPVTAGSQIYVVRTVGGVGVEMVVDHLGVNGTSGPPSLYYESSNCTGTPYANLYSGGFYAGTYLQPGGLLVYASGAQEVHDINSYRSNPTAGCTTYAYGPQPLFPFASFDISQFTPPYSLVAGP
ncbi:MAG TPA: hypothetical protein VFC51_12175 [Chloroflexota bacterium]|nr:hypothetical protein [Chloroflexota bacterium]